MSSSVTFEKSGHWLSGILESFFSCIIFIELLWHLRTLRNDCSLRRNCLSVLGKISLTLCLFWVSIFSQASCPFQFDDCLDGKVKVDIDELLAFQSLYFPPRPHPPAVLGFWHLHPLSLLNRDCTKYLHRAIEDSVPIFGWLDRDLQSGFGWQQMGWGCCWGPWGRLWLSIPVSAGGVHEREPLSGRKEGACTGVGEAFFVLPP